MKLPFLGLAVFHFYVWRIFIPFLEFKEMAEALGWKENSIRGAMSLYAKKNKKIIASEKKDGVRTYYFEANA